MKRTVVTPKPYEGPIPNPMRGFRFRWFQFDYEKYPYNDLLTTVREYFPWNVIEPDASAGVEPILAATEATCPDLPGRNLRMMPRVYLEKPNSARTSSEKRWPADMDEDDWSSPKFLSRCERLIEKMGQAWDNDPRILGVEMGIYGYWGEHHLCGNLKGFPRRMPVEIQRVLGDAFAAAFRNKKVLVRYGNTFADYDFGLYWDSFALDDAIKLEYDWIRSRGDFWKRSPMSGETAYNYGDRESLGHSPDETICDPVRRHRLMDWIRATHASHIGWVSRYNASDPVARAGGEEAEQAFGYRYLVDEFAYTADVGEDGALSASLTLRNVGAAPFYYDWPVMLSLLDPATGQPVYRARMEGDLRTVQPGEDYDWEAHAYRVRPTPVTFALTATLPDELRGGAYIAALSIDDPSCGRPSIRLACENYKNGGWHPLGVVRFGGGDAALPPFDDIRADRSIHYK